MLSNVIVFKCYKKVSEKIYDLCAKNGENAEIQIENGTYQGKYIDTEKWLLNDDQYKIVDPWQITDIC